MSCITVMVGQCGNQLGLENFTAIAESARDSDDQKYQHAVSTTFFRRAGKATIPAARCVMVDMEPKVITACRLEAERAGLFSLGGSDSCVTREEGSGNNWAFGYFAQGASRQQAIQERVASETEAADSVAAFHVIHSVAGGTGSGVGCLISDGLRDAFPHIPIVHSIVWPFAQGEVMTQWINALLTLHVLDESADAVFVLSNDAAAAELKNSTAVPKGGNAFKPINHLFASRMASCFLPRFSYGSDTYHAPSSIHDTISAVALDPSRKFFHAASNPVPLYSTRSSDPGSWKSCVTEMLRLAVRSQSQTGLLVLRGANAATDGVAVATTPLGVQYSDVALHSNIPRSACLFHANNSFARDVAHAAAQVESFAASRAFMHHYDKYGVTSEDIDDALLHGWSIADAYRLPA